jgi:hypothetical protein
MTFLYATHRENGLGEVIDSISPLPVARELKAGCHFREEAIFAIIGECINCSN